MNHALKAIFISALLLALPPAANCANLNEKPLDPRLDAFLSRVIQDPATLRTEKATYAKNQVSFEDLVFVVYTAKIRLDDTPDNSQALAQLGEYIEKERPDISPGLLARLEKFYSPEENRTFMRGMFLETIRGAVRK